MAYVICKDCKRGYDTKINTKCKYCFRSKTQTIKIKKNKKRIQT